MILRVIFNSIKVLVLGNKKVVATLGKVTLAIN
jgi:hypothetical protein